MTHANTIDLNADVIDVRDIIERIEELEDKEPETEQEKWANCDEYATLLALMEEMAGYGGDEEWRGEWYPSILIHEAYFVNYVQELLEDCGEIPANLPHYIHIDWERTARDVKVDYSEVTIDGVSYFYR